MIMGQTLRVQVDGLLNRRRGDCEGGELDRPKDMGTKRYIDWGSSFRRDEVYTTEMVQGNYSTQIDKKQWSQIVNIVVEVQ
jgi:hypothetical protein